MRLMASPASFVGPVNLGNPQEFTMRQLAEAIIGLTSSRSELTTKPLPEDDPKQRQPDITKAAKELSWSPTVKLEEGLKRTIEYFEGVLSGSKATACRASPA